MSSLKEYIQNMSKDKAIIVLAHQIRKENGISASQQFLDNSKSCIDVSEVISEAEKIISLN